MSTLIDRITPETWHKGSAGTFPRGCLAAHVADAASTMVEGLDALARIDRIVLLLYTERVDPTKGPRVTAQFNDHPDTTLDDVHRVVKFFEGMA